MGWINKSVAAVWYAGQSIRAMAARPNEISTSKDLDDWLRFGGQDSASGVSVNVANAQGLAAVAASVRVLSNSLSQLPLQVLRRDGERREPARDLPIYRLLHDQPNEWQTSYQWRKLKMRDLLLRGNAYSYKVPGTRGPQELIRLHPDRVKVEQDPRTLELTYEYHRPDGMTRRFRRDEIFHVWDNSDDGIVGLNPLQVYRESIGDGLAIRQHGSKFFSNGAKPLGVIEMEGKMGKEARDAFREDWDETYAGGANAHKTLLLPAGISYKPVSITMEDAQWIEARKITAREIYGIFGIPPHKAGDLADATFANVQQENLGFVIDSLSPWTVCWEQAIQRDLLGDTDLRAKFNVAALLRGDVQARADFYTKMVSIRAMSPNEVREKEDMNPYEGGDEYANPNIDRRQPQEGQQ